MDQNKQLKFLDTLVHIDNNNNLELKFYLKNEPYVFTNFVHGVAPKTYKTSTLYGEIYRRSYTNTTENELNLSLNKLKEIFENNLYPPKLIKKKSMK